MVIADQQPAAGKHQRSNELGTSGFGGFFDNDPVELLPRLH